MKMKTLSSKDKFILIFAVCVLFTAGAAFLFKLIEFSYTIGSGQAVDFAIIPVAMYLTVAAGFVCMFIWAYLSGHFKDLEGPATRMLEMDEEFEREEKERASRDGHISKT